MATAVRRFETPPGKQAQVDWGHLGLPGNGGEQRRVWGFTITLGYSRRMMGAKPRLDQKLGTLLRMHEAAFQRVGRGSGRDSVRPDEDHLARHRRARRDHLERGVSGLRALLGFQAAAVPAVPGADQRQRSNRA